ncbi:MAG: SDR family oxidoreductase [Chlorobiaceae bacterium]|nr:SDR family oxidoreductase [Chlorobiaceae bacterium]
MTRKIAIITGGSRGLGANAALKLAARNTDLIITYRENKTAADEVVFTITNLGARATALHLDAGSVSGIPAFTEQVKETLEQWGAERFDILINNAGMGINAAFADVTEAQFDALFNVHLKSVFFLTQALVPLMADGGRILNVSSGLARFTLPGYSVYASMKGALEVLTRYLAKELGHRGISVYVLAPGAIETDFGGGTVRDNKQVNSFIASGTALGRVGLPDDIGDLIAALVSDDCRWVNAQRIEASGGVFI